MTALHRPPSPCRRQRAPAPPRPPGQRLSMVAAVLLGGLTLSLCAGALAAQAGFVSLSPDQQDAFGIELAPPVPATETLTRRYPANVAVPNRQLRVVSAPRAGVLESLLVAEGERVSTGQVLAQLSSPELVQVQSGLLEAVTRLELAESELARDRMLFDEGVIAQRRLLESRAKHTELATRVDQQRQLLRLAGLSEGDVNALIASRSLSSRLPVRAPIGGVVLEQMVNTGQSVAAAAPLYRVAELAPLWIEVHVPVEQLGGLAPGARVQLPALGLGGTVVTVGRMVHGEDQGVLVRAEVTEGTERLRPGQFIEVQLSAATHGGDGGWRVPAGALMRNAGRAYLFAAREGGFAVLPAEVLAEEEQSAVVSADLTDADRIAVSGVVALKAAWLADADAGAGGE